ncbi:MAG: nuclear transport factor 2 family protein [Acidobacteriota bacterium]
MKKLVFAAMVATFGVSLFAALPVKPVDPAKQKDLLKSEDARLAINKKVAYDFFRVVLQGRRLELSEQYMHNDYMQHNPNADTGIAGFKAYFSALPGGPQPIPDTLAGLVSIQAEGDYVTLAFVREYDDPAKAGAKYTTTWFDMLRIVDGKVAEHWDSALKGAPGPVAAAAAAPKPVPAKSSGKGK